LGYRLLFITAVEDEAAHREQWSGLRRLFAQAVSRQGADRRNRQGHRLQRTLKSRDA
jgi:hypothetical protein